MGDWVIATLSKNHEFGHFSCGQTVLDDFLKKFARQYAKRKLGTTYVALAQDTTFRAIEVEASDGSAAAFYRKYGFLPFPDNPKHLAIPLETVESALRQ